MTNIALQGRILEILLEHCGNFVPASTFTVSAGVSQAELVPLIASLQSQGVSITVSSADGYRLNALPDRLVPPLIQQGLKTARAAREIHYFIQTDSTNRI
ncbi:MAG: hypothetical protein NTY29_11825, partial [Proteobacteria bacterium]|nr:hypothetical protein [Pseudomonadota bacterium]